MNNKDLGWIALASLIGLAFVVLKIFVRVLFDFGLIYAIVGVMLGIFIFQHIVVNLIG